MTLNGHFALKSVSGSATNGLALASPVFGKNVWRLAELPIYCQRQKCSPGNVVSGGIRFMQILAGVRWRGGVKWEWARRKWRFSVHSVTVFRTFYIHGHTTAFRWYDCQWPWAYFKVIWLFHIKFIKNGVWYGKSYYRQLIGNHTLAFDWCHFWWPWRSFQPRLSFPRPFQQSLACLRVARSPSSSWACFLGGGTPVPVGVCAR